MFVYLILPSLLKPEVLTRLRNVSLNRQISTPCWLRKVFSTSFLPRPPFSFQQASRRSLSRTVLLGCAAIFGHKLKNRLQEGRWTWVDDEPDFVISSIFAAVSFLNFSAVMLHVSCVCLHTFIFTYTLHRAYFRMLLKHTPHLHTVIYFVLNEWVKDRPKHPKPGVTIERCK